MATKTGNPFLDQDFEKVFDFKRYTEQFQVPGLDSTALIEAQRKNIEALTQANRVAFEGYQAVVQRQSEIFRQAMDEAAKAMQDVGQVNAPEDRMAKQAEIAKQAFETAVKNTRELAEMSAKSQNEALELIV
jgi:phasin family protein